MERAAGPCYCQAGNRGQVPYCAFSDTPREVLFIAEQGWEFWLPTLMPPWLGEGYTLLFPTDTEGGVLCAPWGGRASLKSSLSLSDTTLVEHLGASSQPGECQLLALSLAFACVSQGGAFFFFRGVCLELSVIIQEFSAL